MNTPIDNPILTVQNPKQTDFSVYSTNPYGPYTFEKYLDGPFSGFYKRTPVVLRNGRPLIYIKAFFDKPIKYLYRDYLSEYKGFYYIPTSSVYPVSSEKIRRLIYGLQNYEIPVSGNIEEFFKKFYDIHIPQDFCPLIDPCNEDWCGECKTLRYKQRSSMENNYRNIQLSNIILLLSIILCLSFIISGAFIF